MLGYLCKVKARKRARNLLTLTKKDGFQPNDPRWDGTPATHCNEYAYEAAGMCGFDAEILMNDKGIGWTNANDMYRNARAAVVEEKLKELTYKEAQLATNNLKFVLVLAFNLYDGNGHVAVVQRYIKPIMPGKYCRIVQAGAENGEFWLNDIFDLTILTPPMFVQLKKG